MAISGLLARQPELGVHGILHSGVFDFCERQAVRQLLHLDPHGAVFGFEVEEVVLELGEAPGEPVVGSRRHLPEWVLQ